MRALRWLLVGLPLLACAPGPPRPAAPAAPSGIALRVMTFNVEYGGTGVDFAKVIEALELAAPDIVGLEEPEGNTGEIAAALGFHADPRSDVISRFPILDPPGGDGRFVFVEVRPGQVVAMANVHLPSDPYGPYWVAEGRAPQEVLSLERRLRLPELEPVLAALRGLPPMPAFLVGDFNSPSHRDSSGGSASTGIEWPVSLAVERAGFVDSYRSVHPDPAAKPGHTWWAARPAVGDDFTGHPRDRIDFVHAAGAARAVASQIVGEAGARDVDLSVAPWPSDHRALVSSFRVTPAPMPALVSVGSGRLIAAGEPLLVQLNVPHGDGVIALVPGDAAAGAAPVASRPAPAGRGSLELPTVGVAPGAYELVLRSADAALLARAPVRVRAPGEPTRVAPDRSVYAPGDPIGIHWSNGPGNRWDWIGILPEEATQSMENYPLWRHTGTRIDGDLRITGDSEEDRWPLPPGRYRVFYQLHDTVRPVAEARFEVRAPGEDRE